MTNVAVATTWPTPGVPSGPMTLAEARAKFEALCAPHYIEEFELVERLVLGHHRKRRRECVFSVSTPRGSGGGSSFMLAEDTWEKVLKLAELTLEMNKVRGVKGFGQ